VEQIIKGNIFRDEILRDEEFLKKIGAKGWNLELTILNKKKSVI